MAKYKSAMIPLPCFFVLTLCWASAFCMDPRAIFSSTNLTFARPYIGNGHIATQVFDRFIYVQGLYTGEQSENRRVGIPSPFSVRVDTNAAPNAVINYTLNMNEGLFEMSIVQESHSVLQTLYCHSRIPEVAVMTVQLIRNTSLAKLADVTSSNYSLNSNPDLAAVEERRNLRAAFAQNPRVVCFSGNFTGPETPISMCMVHDRINDTFVLEPTMLNLTETYLVVLHSDKQRALDIYRRARSEIVSGVLFARHTDAWKERWVTGRMTFHANADGSTTNSSADQLTRLSHSSLYYLLSSIPAGYAAYQFTGTSNDGLASNLDKGHVGVSQELFMSAGLLLLHPNTVRRMIAARIYHLNSTLNVDGFRGAKFPYSASTGEEVAVSRPGQMDRTRVLYVSGAVAFMVRQYLRTIPKSQISNAEDLRRLTTETAWFYQGIVARNGSISGVLSANGPLTSNHALTNTLAILALRLPAHIQHTFFPHEDLPQHMRMFRETASLIAANYPFVRNSSNGIVAHAADDLSAGTGGNLAAIVGASPEILLNYLPVHSPDFVDSGLLEADLRYYASQTLGRTSFSFIVQALRLTLNTSVNLSASEPGTINLVNRAVENFGIFPTFVNYSSLNSTASVRPDLAAHGAFLQFLLNGYGGFELKADRLVIDPKVPAGVLWWTATGIDYQGFVLSFNFTLAEIHITANPDLASYPDTRSLFVNTSQIISKLESRLSVKRSRIEIMIDSTTNNHWSHSPYLFESNSLPEQKFMPEIGNGYLATVVHNQYVHMNGLYNGEGSASSRARIPSLLSFRVGVTADLVNETYVLDVEKGMFTETKHYRNPSVSVKHELFAHRSLQNLMLTRVTILNHQAPYRFEDMNVQLTGVLTNLTLQSPDIAFSAWTTIPDVTFPKECKYTTGYTKVSELVGGNLTPVTVVYCVSQRLRDNFTIRHSESELHVDVIVAIDTDKDRAVQSILSANRQTFESLRDSHIAKWRWYWDSGRIDVDPTENFELAQALCSCFYFLLSSLPNVQTPNNTFVGLSPGGLAHGAPGAEIDQDYLGHSFWDTEVWMFPPILLFFPDQAKLLLEARTRTLGRARQNSEQAGYSGAKFPWESAFTGIETTPWPPAAVYQIHINGDIAFAVRQFLYASYDKTRAIQDLSLDELVVDIARYWQSRVDCNVRESCSLNDVMGPDEYYYPVNNSAYTNYVAKLSLLLPDYVLPFIGRVVPDMALWRDTAAQITVAESSHMNRCYHPEFDGFSPDHATNLEESVMVKQADVILLGYPLDMEMSAACRRNDLDIYQKLTNPRGPAMTFGMFAVGYLELGQKKLADQFFSRYGDNIQHPFGVWSEEPGGNGAVNFLTGMGGFLQSVMNGYGGFRLRADHLLFDPVAMPQTTRWNVTGLKYLGNHINFGFNFDQNTVSVKVTGQEYGAQLVLETRSKKVYRLDAHHTLIYDREQSSIREQRSGDLFTDPQTGLLVTSTPVSGSKSSISSALLLLVSAAVVLV